MKSILDGIDWKKLNENVEAGFMVEEPYFIVGCASCDLTITSPIRPELPRWTKQGHPGRWTCPKCSHDILVQKTAERDRKYHADMARAYANHNRKRRWFFF